MRSGVVGCAMGRHSNSRPDHRVQTPAPQTRQHSATPLHLLTSVPSLIHACATTIGACVASGYPTASGVDRFDYSLYGASGRSNHRCSFHEVVAAMWGCASIPSVSCAKRANVRDVPLQAVWGQCGLVSAIPCFTSFPQDEMIVPVRCRPDGVTNLVNMIRVMSTTFVDGARLATTR